MDQTPLKAPQHRPTWWMLIVSLIASIALFLQSPQHHPGIIIAAVGITLSYTTRLRLPATGVFPWIIRGAFLMLVIFTAPEDTISARFWYLSRAKMSTIGMCMQVELMMQHWLPYLGRKRLGQMFIAAAGVMLPATATNNGQFIAFLGPLYALANLGILRHFAPAPAVSPAENVPPPVRKSRRWALQGTSIVLAVTIGFIGVGLLQNYQRALMGLGGQWLANLLVRATAGMSGNEKLGSSLDGAGSPARVLRIHGTRQAMHLKGLTFSSYSQGAWLPNFARRTFNPPAGTLNDFGSARTFQVERLIDSLDILYLPYNTPAFSTPADAITEIEPGHAAAVRSVPQSSSTLTYTAALPASDVAQGPLCRPPTDAERKTLLELPTEINPGVWQLADTLKRPTPQETIRAVISNLHANHNYDLKAKKGDGDPVSEFLLDPRYKDAHCQYFASAATMLLRSNGIPTRYVTGYFAWETDNDSMVVRSRDAHAWAESWIDGIGWVLVEATPASGTPDQVNPPVGWYQKLKDKISDALSALGQFVRSLGWIHVAIAGGIITTVAVIVQLIQNYFARRKRPRIRAYDFPAEEYRRLAVEFESMLRRMGDIPSSSATWGEHLADQTAQTHRNRRQEKIDAARRFVEAYNRTRFGRPEDQAALTELKALLEQVKE